MELRAADREARAPRPSLSNSLAGQVLALIAETSLVAGDPLPSVQDLAERSGVSNATMREALRRLEATGSVEFRHGSGLYVGAQVGRVVLANPNSISPSVGLLLKLVEARLVIEPPIAALAAERRTDEHLARLERATAVAQEEHLDGPVPARPNFHRELAAASGNVVLFEVIDALLTAHRSEQRQIRRLSRARAQDVVEHRQIISAVRAADPAAAARASQHHLEAIRSAVADRESAER